MDKGYDKNLNIVCSGLQTLDCNPHAGRESKGAGPFGRVWMRGSKGRNPSKVVLPLGVLCILSVATERMGLRGPSAKAYSLLDVQVLRYLCYAF